MTNEEKSAFLMHYKLDNSAEGTHVIGAWEVEKGDERIASNLLEQALSKMKDSPVILDVPA